MSSQLAQANGKRSDKTVAAETNPKVQVYNGNVAILNLRTGRRLVLYAFGGPSRIDSTMVM